MIYFAQTNDNQYIKIGYAKDAHKRLEGLQTGSPIGVKLLASQPGDAKIEYALHQRFAFCRVRREWFRSVPSLVEYAVQAALLNEARVSDTDPFLRYAIREPRLIPLLAEAAATIDDPNEPSFCANEVFFGYGNVRAGLKWRLSHLVGWNAESNDPGLCSTDAYDAVYERIYEALPNCRHCGCIIESLVLG